MPKIPFDVSVSGLIINRESKITLTRQVYNGVKVAILNKQLRPGQRLPSSRMLAGDIGVSRNIVLLAYEQLTLEGYLAATVGNGSYVAADVDNAFAGFNKVKAMPPPKPATHTDTDLVNFEYDASEEYINRESSKAVVKPFQNPVPALDHFPYRNWTRCANKIFRSLEFLQLSYDDAQGYYPLRQVIAGYLRTNRGLACEAGQIVITNGTQQALNLIANVLIKKGDGFWIEDPGYINARAAFMQAGGKPCFVPVTQQGLNLDYATKKWPEARLAYVTPSHQFPLGGSFPIAKRLQLLNWAADKDMWIIEDDYDSEFRYIAKPIPALQGLDKHQRVIYTGTFTKVLFPGLRIGYLVLPNENLTRAFTHAKAFADRQNAITDQLILNEFMREGYFNTHLHKMRMLYKKRQDSLIDSIKTHGEGLINAEKQASGMHLIAWLKSDLDDTAISFELNKAGIITLPLSVYVKEFKQPPALILGYTAFNEVALKNAIIRMVSVIKSFIKHRA